MNGDITTLVQRLDALLAEENVAARGGDVEGLVSLQEEKRTLLDGLERHPVPAPVLADFSERARGNLLLMRNLSSMLRAFATDSKTATYGNSGQPLHQTHRVTRGAV